MKSELNEKKTTRVCMDRSFYCSKVPCGEHISTFHNVLMSRLKRIGLLQNKDKVSVFFEMICSAF